MFMRTIFSLFIFCAVLLSCNSNSSAPGSTRTASEEELVNRLSSLMVVNPADQEGIDRNLLINYAIDSLLDVKMTPSGIFYSIDEPGTGDSPVYNSQLSAHYRGRLLNGKIFDSSYTKGEPLYFNMQQVIRGWQQGLEMLKVGGKATLLIPSHLAYGNNGFSGLIPPNSPLRFEIELVAIHGTD